MAKEAIEIHTHRNRFNGKEEILKLDRIWIQVLENTNKRVTK